MIILCLIFISNVFCEINFEEHLAIPVEIDSVTILVDVLTYDSNGDNVKEIYACYTNGENSYLYKYNLDGTSEQLLVFDLNLTFAKVNIVELNNQIYFASFTNAINVELRLTNFETGEISTPYAISDYFDPIPMFLQTMDFPEGRKLCLGIHYTDVVNQDLTIISSEMLVFNYDNNQLELDYVDENGGYDLIEFPGQDFYLMCSIYGESGASGNIMSITMRQFYFDSAIDENIIITNCLYYDYCLTDDRFIFWYSGQNGKMFQCRNRELTDVIWSHTSQDICPDSHTGGTVVYASSPLWVGFEDFSGNIMATTRSLDTGVLIESQNVANSYSRSMRISDDMVLFRDDYYHNEHTIFYKLDNDLLTDNDELDHFAFDDYKLQNFPNPFNPETTFSFNLEKTSNIKLTVYNAKGQLVKTLVKDEYQAGEHLIRWAGKDNNGENVSSGIYFYKLNVDNKIVTNKCVLMK
jgi:hypothetical protein